MMGRAKDKKSLPSTISDIVDALGGWRQAWSLVKPRGSTVAGIIFLVITILFFPSQQWDGGILGSGDAAQREEGTVTPPPPVATSSPESTPEKSPDENAENTATSATTTTQDIEDTQRLNPEVNNNDEGNTPVGTPPPVDGGARGGYGQTPQSSTPEYQQNAPQTSQQNTTETSTQDNSTMRQDSNPTSSPVTTSSPQRS